MQHEVSFHKGKLIRIRDIFEDEDVVEEVVEGEVLLHPTNQEEAA